MSNYKKSSQTAKFHESDLPTATKTNYYESSAIINTPSLKSPTKLIHSKIQGVRDSIGSIINQISHKKNQNLQAVDRVRNVNADALAVMRDYHEQHPTYTPKKSNRVSYPRQNRTIGAIPSYDYQPIIRDQGYMPQFNLQGQDYHQQIRQAPPQFKSLEQQNMELRQALNEQLRVNGELIKRINFLQAQNNDLKVQLGHPDSKLRSTRYGNSYQDFNNELSPIERQPSAQNAKVGSSENIRSSYGIRQPGYANYGRNGVVGGGNSWGIQNQAAQLLSDLDRLKRENESLRQNTLTLLQKQ